MADRSHQQKKRKEINPSSLLYKNLITNFYRVACARERLDFLGSFLELYLPSTREL